MAIKSKARHDLTLRSIKREIAASLRMSSLPSPMMSMSA